MGTVLYTASFKSKSREQTKLQELIERRGEKRILTPVEDLHIWYHSSKPEISFNQNFPAYQ